MTRISPIRFPEATRNGRDLMRAMKAEAEAADYRALAEQERRARPAGATAFVALCIAAAVAIPGVVLALMQWGWI